jgi:hypothetical protein
LKERDHLDDLGIDGRIIKEMKEGGKVWTCFIYLRVETSGGML